MSDKGRQVRDSLIYVLPVAAGNLLPLATLPVFTRLLTKEDYGVLALAQIYAVFVSGLAGFGLPVAYERNFFEHKEPGPAAGLFYSVLSFVAAGLALAGALTWALQERFASWITGSAQNGRLLFWSFCAAGAVGLRFYFQTYLRNREDAASFSRYALGEAFVSAASSVFFVGYLRVGAVGLVWGPLTGAVAMLALLAARFVRELPPAFDIRLLRECLAIGVPLTPRVFLGVVSGQFDKYMIGLLGTVGGVGIYSIGQKAANLVFLYMTAIENVFSPKVYARMFDPREGGAEEIGRYLTPFAYVSALMGLGLALFAEEAVFVLTPPPFHGAADIATVLALYCASLFFAKQPQLIYAKKTHWTAALSALHVALNVALNIPFILAWGALGAAWATLLSGLIYGVVLFAASQRVYEIRWEYGKIAAMFGVLMGSACLLLVLRQAGAPYWTRAVLKAAALGGFAWMGARWGLLTRENFGVLARLGR